MRNLEESGERAYAQWARGYRWAFNLASKMGVVAISPVNLESTFIFQWKLQQFESEFDKDFFVQGYRAFCKDFNFKG